MFGQQRFARLQPEADQQPTYYAGDIGNETALGPITGTEAEEIKGRLEDNKLAGGGYPVKLMVVRYANGKELFRTDKQLQAELQVNPNLAHEIVTEALINSEDDMLLLENKFGQREKLETGGLLRGGLSLDSSFADTTLVDASGMLRNRSLNH